MQEVKLLDFSGPILTTHTHTLVISDHLLMAIHEL